MRNERKRTERKTCSHASNACETGRACSAIRTLWFKSPSGWIIPVESFMGWFSEIAQSPVAIHKWFNAFMVQVPLVQVSFGSSLLLVDPLCLDLSQNRTVPELQSAWERVDGDLNGLTNCEYAMAYLPNQNVLFMDGGYATDDPANNTLLPYRSETYDVQAGTGWTQVIPERPLGSAPTEHTATLGPDNNTVYIWGGFRARFSGAQDGEYTRPREMFIFDIRNSASPWTTGASAPSGSRGHAAVLVGSSIFYIGGSYIDSLTESGYYAMNSVRVFETESGQWSNRSVGGSDIPTGRQGHTVTLKPTTGEIILFGEELGHAFDTRSMYVLNTQGNELSWSKRTVQATDDSTSPPAQHKINSHSATLVGPYLFILFGLSTETGGLIITLNETWIMDVDQWAWVSSFDAMSLLDGASTSTPGGGGSILGQTTEGSGSNSGNTGSWVGFLLGFPDESPSTDVPSSVPSPPDCGDVEQNNNNSNVRQPDAVHMT
ncbi:hypothetical protein BDA99DRAFT_559412 [Phascolomyces articulosus]|uniref:Kelch repeat protein n=1 Tax=Phascolomyces articulosus TaxID=60185 RepID=A0AAD5K0V9_9FUNG|nr:hypothetical protein BDA99DRAFT_559412 [Phascolomyces articulosus]